MKYLHLIGLLFLMSCGNNEVGRYLPVDDYGAILVDTKTGDVCVSKSNFDQGNKTRYKKCGDH